MPQECNGVEECAGVVAQDFNNQLAGILGYAEILQTGLTHDTNLANYAGKIITGITRATELKA